MESFDSAEDLDYAPTSGTLSVFSRIEFNSKVNRRYIIMKVLSPGKECK